MNRREQREKRREEILIAALDLFIRKGYAATRTLDISQAVGMSEGLLFHHFESKEKLYEAWHSETVSPVVKELMAQMDVFSQCIPLIKAGQKNKTIRDGDPYALSIAFWSAVNGIAANMALTSDAQCP